MKKIVTVAGAIALTAVMAAPVMAHRETGMGYGSGPGNVADIGAVKGLGLTAEQTRKICVLREAHLKEIKPLQGEMLGKSRELRSLWLASTPDKEKILALQQEVQTLRDQLVDKRTAYFLEVRQVLTPEQQAKVRAYGIGAGAVRMGGGPGMTGGHGYGGGMR